MDLRIVKTRKNIRDAFLKLRAQSPLEKIKVKHLCDLALINKTTFYKHYQDIFALSDEIENETIRSILDNFAPSDLLFTDPEKFVKGLYSAFKAHEDSVLLLFSGRLNVLIDKVENQLMAHYPSLSKNPENSILFSFLIHGASSLLVESRYEETIMLDTVIRIVKRALAMFDETTLSLEQGGR